MVTQQFVTTCRHIQTQYFEIGRDCFLFLRHLLTNTNVLLVGITAKLQAAKGNNEYILRERNSLYNNRSIIRCIKLHLAIPNVLNSCTMTFLRSTVCTHTSSSAVAHYNMNEQ
jgi:hypothetical protein